MKDIILTGDRPTGKLHIGHYVGSLKERVRIQNEGNYDKLFIMIADAQALTDNAKDVSKVKENIIEVALDYLAVGIDPKKSIIFIQSEVEALTELTFYYSNLVSLSRLLRNPTVKEEIKQKGFENSVPVGFATYPISQASDITAFQATLVPVGEDQLPMIEQTKEIVRTFNSTYSEVLVEPKAVLPKEKVSLRLPGIDGKAKMSKSLNNAIYLSDEPEILKQKVRAMYTDPNHIKVPDPGEIKGNVVFTYLDAFSNETHFAKYLPQFKNLEALKTQYKKGGIGDVLIKNFLYEILNEILTPIREKRKELEKNKKAIYEMLFEGSDKARLYANETLKKVKQAMGIDYRS